jgi:nucleoside phosphorylase
MERAKAKLGDVVISAKLATYDDKKFKADGAVVFHGTKANVSRNMARLILNAAHGWKPPLKDPKSLDVEVHHDAVTLSGSDLVNNRERRQELLNSFPDALGLEMEGAGRNFPHHLGTPPQLRSIHTGRDSTTRRDLLVFAS